MPGKKCPGNQAVGGALARKSSYSLHLSFPLSALFSIPPLSDPHPLFINKQFSGIIFAACAHYFHPRNLSKGIHPDSSYSGTGWLRFLLIFLFWKCKTDTDLHIGQMSCCIGVFWKLKCRSESTIKAALLTSRQLIFVKVQVKQRQWKLYISFKHSLLSILSGWFQQVIERFCLSDTFKEPQTFY